MKIYFLSLALLVLPAWMSGQEVLKCYTPEAENQLREENPSLGTKEDFENWLRKQIEATTEAKSGSGILSLPVVFHVIHHGESVGTGSNVSNEAIYAQIEQLNNDYRRTPGTSGYNTHPDGADMQIEFCPAQLNPAGNLMQYPGIHRVNGSNRSWGADAYSTSYFDYFVKPETVWDPEKYINIWVSATSSYFYNVLGYAQFPVLSGLPGLDDQEDVAETDGIVVNPYTLGSTDFPNPDAIGNTGMGKTLTHEMGHFLGLRHIWGDGPCGTDDYCNDTPPASEANEGCPTDAFSCGTPDMIENYMDYTDDPCKNTFTQDQKSRVVAVILNSPRRASLLLSKVCTPVQTCNNPLPAPTDMNVQVSVQGAHLTWNPPVGAMACMLQAGSVSGSAIHNVPITGNSIDEFQVPANLLSPGKTYRWRVRCSCTENDRSTGIWSGIQYFNTGSGIGQTAAGSISASDNLQMDVYPNPAEEEFTIRAEGISGEEGLLEIYDLLGRRLYTERIVFSGAIFNKKIEVTDALRESYLLIRLTSGSNTVTHKIMTR